MINVSKIKNFINSSKKSAYFGWFVLTLSVILLNEIGTKYPLVSHIALFAEFFICLISFLLGSIEYGFIFFIIFLSNTLEVQYFVTGIREMNGSFYSFAYLPVLKPFTLLILCSFMYMSVYFRKNYVNIGMSQNKPLVFLHRTVCYMSVCGILWMVVLYAVNDNGVMDLTWYVDLALKKIIRLAVTFFTVESCILLLLGRPAFSTMLNNALVGSLFALPIAGFLGAMLGLTGYRGFVTGLSLLPIYSSLGIYLLLFSKYSCFSNQKNKTLFFSLLLVLYFLLYPSQMGGKFVISIAITLLLFLFASKSVAMIFSIMIAFLLFFFSNELLTLFFGNNSFVLQKIEEAKSIFLLAVEGSSGFQQNENVGSRFDEFLNVYYEYVDKPFYFLFGKGAAGTILHHTNFLSWDGEAMFTPDQIASGVFVELHESTNVVFLRYGLIGLLGYGKLIWYLLKAMKCSPWAIFGLTWLVFYLDIFYSMFFGVAALVLALYQLNSRGTYVVQKIDKRINA